MTNYNVNPHGLYVNLNVMSKTYINKHLHRLVTIGSNALRSDSGSCSDGTYSKSHSNFFNS